MPKKKRSGRFVYWTPRILSIAFILFLALFSLDVFDSCQGVFDCALGLFMHNIPSLVLLVILLISWRYEIVGGIAFILAGLLFIVLSVFRVVMSSPVEWYMLVWTLQIAGPAFLIGILFLIGWRRRKKRKQGLGNS
jgi:hypothetical protein